MNNSLKRKLDYHYKYFDRTQISPYPLEFLHKYSSTDDIELIGFISSVFAYGNVKQIIKTLAQLEVIFENQPAEFIKNFNLEKDAGIFENIKHRFYTYCDVALLFGILHEVYVNYSSLRKLFLLYYFEQDDNLKNSVSFFSNNLVNISRHISRDKISQGLQFMFPDPFKGSACKRMNLFLRWMIRKDELDFGIWTEIPTSQLIIPVDTHVAKICRELRLTRIKNVSWKMAEDITNNLKKYDSQDPVKYDFAICHIGMRKMDF